MTFLLKVMLFVILIKSDVMKCALSYIDIAASRMRSCQAESGAARHAHGSCYAMACQFWMMQRDLDFGGNLIYERVGCN